ncbi:histone-lysine N-methyltransferase mes-4 [Oreochromis niloticus]|uniref:histone-lysine N-methyltransferase mes-4 n=1 Tax=Oreochromis niloticus TaxID=8128 RepID=UPI000DF353C4|nr:histone-lysine N-methyltransferase mes-4-like [Oreochromis niloticus]
MAATRPRRAKINPRQDASYYCSLGEDKAGFDVRYIDSFKGRGVFSCRSFQKGDFLFEYRGQIITKEEQENRMKLYHDALKVFIFDFKFNGKQLCVDAAREDGSLGRLVNDDNVNPNSKMTVTRVDGRPHLCLFAIKDIGPGEEITYNYGDSNWPWRSKKSNMVASQAVDENAASSSPNDATKKSNMVASQAVDENAASSSPNDATKKSNMVASQAVDENAASSSPNEATKKSNMVASQAVDENAASSSPNDATKKSNMVPSQAVDENAASSSPNDATKKSNMVASQAVDENAASSSPNDSTKDCDHDLVPDEMSSLEKCFACGGPFSPLKWSGVRCEAQSKNGAGKVIEPNRILNKEMKPSSKKKTNKQSASLENARRVKKHPWSPTEVAAIMKYFGEHIKKENWPLLSNASNAKLQKILLWLVVLFKTSEIL